ncbi:MAG: AzlD domain-containing protein [Anaerolineales bacterium]|jgi:branched-subunit amino acid transport protein
MTGKELFLILGMAAVTFGIRFVLFALAELITFPGLVKQSLKYIPPAVLTAITVPAVLMPEGSIDISLRNPYLIAGLLAATAGILSKNLLVTILIGLVGFFLYQVILF